MKEIKIKSAVVIAAMIVFALGCSDTKDKSEFRHSELHSIIPTHLSTN